MASKTNYKLTDLEGISKRDKKLLEDADSMLGPEPDKLGFIKDMFWGRISHNNFPHPYTIPEETAKCNAVLKKLNVYLKEEHPAMQIDREEEIPPWVIEKLFELDVMRLTIPKEYGGLGLGITSYNRVLQCIGYTCSSTSVLVSTHQSVGCKAIMLFGTPEQKQKWLPSLATNLVSAFCLSEPNVGCDAGGQETTCTESDDPTEPYIINGEKKWSTSGAIAGILTVTARHKYTDSKTGQLTEGISAFIVTPDMEGFEVLEKNRSKCGIRGTWQARLGFKNMKVPRENLLHIPGKGLTVALSCLNYGRCTLSAGILGASTKCMQQGMKWAETRHQFQRPLWDFELVKSKIAFMSAITYAMEFGAFPVNC